MERCDFNLEQFREVLWEPTAWETMLVGPRDDESAFDVDARLKVVWVILSQITNGLNFIHLQKEIHRDLKPSNGMAL